MGVIKIIKKKMMEYAPIILFTYNRPDHLEKTINSLKSATYANQSNLYIYSDGPKNHKDDLLVAKVRKYIETINGFNSIHRIYNSENLGLAKNIEKGIGEILTKSDRVIVLEDDIIVNKYFLQYMNAALERYIYESKVWHISGYMYPIEDNPHLSDTFFLRPATCWGWGTWSRAWKNYSNNSDILFNRIKPHKKIFNLGNSYEYFKHLELNKKRKMRTWAIHWYASIFLGGGYSLHPNKSYTSNIGHDGLGTHSELHSIFDVNATGNFPVKFPGEISESVLAKKLLTNYFLSIKKSIIRRAYEKITKIFKKII